MAVEAQTRPRELLAVALHEGALIHFLEREPAIETVDAAAEKAADRRAPGEPDQSSRPARPVTGEEHADQGRNQPAFTIPARSKQDKRHKSETRNHTTDHTEHFPIVSQ